MATDDYFIIVYKILNYLYEVLIDGRPTYCFEIQNDGSLVPIMKEKYWNTIIDNLISNGYILENETKFLSNGKEYAREVTYSISKKGIKYMYLISDWIEANLIML